MTSPWRKRNGTLRRVRAQRVSGPTWATKRQKVDDPQPLNKESFSCSAGPTAPQSGTMPNHSSGGGSSQAPGQRWALRPRILRSKETLPKSQHWLGAKARHTLPFGRYLKICVFSGPEESPPDRPQVGRKRWPQTPPRYRRTVPGKRWCARSGWGDRLATPRVPKEKRSFSTWKYLPKVSQV